jgi:Ran GTPase-activating protein (RanGAP) involved in mRNA processing and transport
MKEYGNVESLIIAANAGATEVKLKFLENVTWEAVVKLEQIKMLAEFLGKHETLLEKLDLSGNKLNAECAEVLAPGLAKNTSLRSLHLNANFMGDKGASVLASVLLENRTLQELNIAYNKIKDGGVAAIASSLMKNFTIKCLSLNGNNISDVGARHIELLLTQNETLEKVGMKSCINASGYNNLYQINDVILEQINKQVRINILENKAYKSGALSVILKLPTDVCGLILGFIGKPTDRHISKTCVDAYKAAEPRWAERALIKRAATEKQISL